MTNTHQNYECVLCPLRTTEPDLFEPPKISHKKKTDREREKERMEKELVEKARDEYRLKQQEKGRPVVPREPLKRTADNNWVHVYCALWHPETKFSNAVRLDMVEGIGAPTLRYDAICKLCKTNDGACAACQQCHTNFHVGCAHNAGYTFGFDMTPVKATRRDAVPTVTLNGETGTMMAAIWCKDHVPKTIVHPMGEEVEGTDLNALQLFAREFKQADLTLTGTARKANLVDQSTRVPPSVPAPVQGNRRTSTVTLSTPLSARGRPSNAGLTIKDEPSPEMIVAKPERKCVRCKIDASPRWWKIEEGLDAREKENRATEGSSTANGIDVDPHQPKDYPVHTNHTLPTTNGGDHPMTDAPSAIARDQPARLRVDTNTNPQSSSSYLCQKCHWKKLNAPDGPEELAQSGSVHLDAQQLPLRSPPVQPFAAPPPPPALGGPWAPPPQQHPPLPHWHSAGHPGAVTHPQPSHGLHNGIGHAAPAPMGHHAPFAPYSAVHQPNGYPAYSAPPVHAHIPPAPLRGPYPSPHHHNGPPPLHLTNGAMMVNGIHSPHVPYSPTHPPPVHNSSRSTESPYNAAPQLPYPPLHHGSPAPGGPPTPRDATMRDPPPVTAPQPPQLERVNTGASASPSLRNLLH